MRTLTPIALLLSLVACSDPGTGDDAPDELPTSFRVEAEIVSVEPGPGLPASAADLCTPTTADIDPDGPDWSLAFDRMHDAEEPTFKEWTTSENADSANQCRLAGGEDCCRPLASVGDGWVLVCDGEDSGLIGAPRNRFEFTFNADGSGSAAATRARADGVVVCSARVSWAALILE